MAGERIRVCVCVSDEELRSWLIEELGLMTWIGELEMTSLANLADALAHADLIIIESDSLTPADLERLATTHAPVIAVGTKQVCANRMFGPTLTSRELRQAIRELVLAPRPAASTPA